MIRKRIKREKAADRPPYSTRISQRVLLALGTLGPTSIYGILEALEDHKGVSHGTVWNILDRARQNGLVQRDGPNIEKRELWSLTNGGHRRVEWIQKNVEELRGWKPGDTHRAVENAIRERKRRGLASRAIKETKARRRR